MAKKDKDKLYYELTREKPMGTFHMMIVGGTLGTVFGFMISTLWGLLRGADLDGLVLGFLASSFLGFLLGAGVVWTVLRFWGKLTSGPSAGSKSPAAPGQAPEAEVPSPLVEDEEAKGKS